MVRLALRCDRRRGQLPRARGRIAGYGATERLRVPPAHPSGHDRAIRRRVGALYPRIAPATPSRQPHRTDRAAGSIDVAEAVSEPGRTKWLSRRPAGCAEQHTPRRPCWNRAPPDAVRHSGVGCAEPGPQPVVRGRRIRCREFDRRVGVRIRRAPGHRLARREGRLRMTCDSQLGHRHGLHCRLRRQHDQADPGRPGAHHYAVSFWAHSIGRTILPDGRAVPRRELRPDHLYLLPRADHLDDGLDTVLGADDVPGRHRLHRWHRHIGREDGRPVPRHRRWPRSSSPPRTCRSSPGQRRPTRFTRTPGTAPRTCPRRRAPQSSNGRPRCSSGSQASRRGTS